MSVWGDHSAGLMTCNLPGDVMMEILSRLPIKTLIKFTSVCKAWGALIKNQAFIDLHFQQSTSLDNNHYLITRGNKLTNLTVTDTFFVSYDYKLEKVNLSVGLFHPGLVGVVGSCHGLICTTPNDFVMCGNSYIIYNPATHEFKEIYKHRKHDVITRKSHFISSGFGYDSCLHDYKIVRLEQYEVNNKVLSFCDVYSKSSDSWKRIDADVNGTLVERLSKANINGSLHWLAKRNDRAYILYFNISEQVFGEIMLPKLGPEKYFHLHVWKQCLALIYYLMEPPCENQRIEIWWMKEYGLRRSWAKERVIGPNPGFYLILASRDNGQFMFINENTENVFVYDHTTSEAKHVALPAVMPGNSNKEVQVVNYKESLIRVNEHSKFEMKGYPSETNLTWKQHLPVLFLMCWWFCSWMGSDGLNNLSWEIIMSRTWIDMRGAMEHVWRLVFACIVLVGGLYVAMMVIAFLASFIQLFRE